MTLVYVRGLAFWFGGLSDVTVLASRARAPAPHGCFWFERAGTPVLHCLG